MNQINRDEKNFQYFGIGCGNSGSAEDIDFSPCDRERPKTLRADSKLRAKGPSTPVSERLKSTFSGIYQALNLSFTVKAENQQCKFNGHILPGNHTSGHYPRCTQCGKIINDVYTLRRTNISSSGALNGQVIVPSQDYWIDESVIRGGTVR